MHPVFGIRKGVSVFMEKQKNTRSDVILLLCAILPTLFGYLYNVLMPFIPIEGVAFRLYFLLLPIIFVYVWYKIGMKYLHMNIRLSLVQKVLIGNSIALLALLVFLWQFVLQTDESRNTFLAGISQCTFNFLSVYTWRIAYAFESVQDETGSLSFIMMHVIGFVVFVVAFAFGLYREIKKIKAAEAAAKAAEEENSADDFYE